MTGVDPFRGPIILCVSLSEILCLRHSMTNRSIYAKQEEAGGSWSVRIFVFEALKDLSAVAGATCGATPGAATAVWPISYP